MLSSFRHKQFFISFSQQFVTYKFQRRVRDVKPRLISKIISTSVFFIKIQIRTKLYQIQRTFGFYPLYYNSVLI